eukprot:1359950-Alexandrium_andersonii.AAC.1
MSASLVGSEMCIRDRRHIAPQAMLSLSGGGLGGKSTRPETGPGRAHATVSYTHLTLPTICSV